MPNWVENKVTMRNIGKLPIYTEDENKEAGLDFNKILSMDDSLDVESGSYTDIAINEVIISMMEYVLANSLWGEELQLYRSVCSKLRDIQNRSIEKDNYHSKDELLQFGLQYVSNIVKHGYPTWYQWCIKNWGTKWNAWDTEIISDDCIRFFTAWGIPEKIFIELSKMYPYDEIRVDWMVEYDVAGYTTYLDGECIEGKEYEVYYESDYNFDKPQLFTEVRPIERITMQPSNNLTDQIADRDQIRIPEYMIPDYIK